MDKKKIPVILNVVGFVPREVAMVEYSFFQAIDIEGQTVGIPRGGKIKVKVKAMNDGNCELLNWMCDRSLAKNGKIEFWDTLESKKMKNIEFKDGYCVEFQEFWEDPKITDNDKAQPPFISHWEQITISCKEITNQAATYKNAWS